MLYGWLISGLLLIAVERVAAQEPAAIPPIPEALRVLLPPDEQVLAKVNGLEVRGAEVRVRMLSSPLAEQAHPQALDVYVQQSVDRVLIEQFLKARQVDVPEQLLEQRIEAFRQAAAQGTGDSAAALARMGLNDKLLRRQVSLSLAWLKHAQGTLTEAQFQEYFNNHRVEVDGTRVPISQVFVAVPASATEAEWESSSEKLRQLGDSPELEEVGATTFRNRKLPAEVTQAAFALSPGQLSEVIRSPLGVHRIRVGERIPGQLSLEDARPAIFPILSQQLWDAEVQRQRAKARIQVLLPPQ